MKLVKILLYSAPFFVFGPNAEKKSKLASMLEKSIQSAEVQIDGMKNRLTHTLGELEAMRDKLLVLKQPQFLRTPNEREVQIRDQTIRIEQLENEVQNISNGIQVANDKVRGWKNSLYNFSHQRRA